jgi:hypothetical protein
MNKSGKLVWFYSFNGNESGLGPASLLRDAAGNFYGTTVEGGKQTKACGGTQNPGCGVVFKLDVRARKRPSCIASPGFSGTVGFPKFAMVHSVHRIRDFDADLDR